MSKRQIVLTEQDIRNLVIESLQIYLGREIVTENINETVWGGVKNAANAIGNGQFNVIGAYRGGNNASSFQKYGQKAIQALTPLINVANKAGAGQIAQSLQKTQMDIQKDIQNFNTIQTKSAMRGSQQKGLNQGQNANAGAAGGQQGQGDQQQQGAQQFQGGQQQQGTQQFQGGQQQQQGGGQQPGQGQQPENQGTGGGARVVNMGSQPKVGAAASADNQGGGNAQNGGFVNKMKGGFRNHFNNGQDRQNAYANLQHD